MKNLMFQFILIISCFISSHAQSINTTFFSYISPDLPTTQDSITILSQGYITYGILTDSSFSISGNDIILKYSVIDSVRPDHYIVNSKRNLGMLSLGKYRIITATVYKHTRGYNAFTSDTSSDTINFNVSAETVLPPKIVGFRYSNQYIGVGGTNNFTQSYYYWNGDTLSVAVGFESGGNKFIAQLSMQSDTIVINNIDTTFRRPAIVQDYLCVTSIASLKPGIYPFKIKVKFITEGLNILSSLVVDNKKEGIGISLKKAGIPEYILYLNPELDFYYIYSPFLDTLKTFSLQPNPHFKVTGTHNIFIGYPSYESLSGHWDPINFWDSTYHKSDWSYTSVQAMDRFDYDTIGLGTGTIFKIDYSSDNNDTVLSYTHRTITPNLISQSPYPGLCFNASFTDPNTGTTNPPENKTEKKQLLNDLRIVHSGQKVHISFQSSSLQPDVKISIVDIYGRVVSRPESQAPAAAGSLVSVFWDKRNSKGKIVAKGTYFVMITNGNRHYSAKVNITE